MSENYKGLGLIHWYPDKKDYIQVIDKSKGLPTNLIHDLKTDPAGGLWLALDEGIAHLETHTPLSVFDERNGLSGPVYTLRRFRDTLYVGTTQGLFYLDPLDAEFHLIQSGNFWTIQTLQTPTGERLLASSTFPDAWWTIAGKRAELLFHRVSHTVSIRPAKADTLVFCGKEDISKIYTDEKGLLRIEACHWLAQKGDIYFLEEDALGNLWAMSEADGLFRIPDYLNAPEGAEVFRYGIEKGLPSLDFKKVRPFAARGLLHLATPQGVLVFDDTQDRFVLSNLLGNNRTPAQLVQTDSTGNLWAILDKKLHRFDPQGKYLSEESHVFERMPRPAAVESLLTEADQLWIGTTERLYHYDIGRTFVATTPAAAYLQYVQAGADTLSPTQADHIPFHKNTLTFGYAASFFQANKPLSYAYWLQGYDAGWSLPTTRTQKEYTNLSEGDYVFWVKALNAYGVYGPPVQYAFSILPPWYRTWWAYLAYLLLAVGGVWGIVRLNAIRLRQEKDHLEALVQARTQTLEEQKEEIAQQAEKITFQAEKITDSIRYARTIQEAILPTTRELNQHFKDYFIIYQPKDIVSGDFFWMAKIPQDQGFMIALADCTGHGVPGGFMSMIGKALLDEAIQERHLLRPAQILTWLDQAVRQTLKQEEEGGSDGMDITLCHFVPQSGGWQCTFAGAGQHLILCPADRTPPVRIRGVARAIGGKRGGGHRKQAFTEQEQFLPRDTRVYLYSDGVVDMGNIEKERFGTQRFMQQIAVISAQPMSDQKAHFEQVIRDFQAGSDQRDDITLIGFRVLASPPTPA